MAWLLDTNILSELRRLKPEPRVLSFIASHPLDQFYISAVTLAERRYRFRRTSARAPKPDAIKNHVLGSGVVPVVGVTLNAKSQFAKNDSSYELPK